MTIDIQSDNRPRRSVWRHLLRTLRTTKEILVATLLFSYVLDYLFPNLAGLSEVKSYVDHYHLMITAVVYAIYLVATVRFSWIDRAYFRAATRRVLRKLHDMNL